MARLRSNPWIVLLVLCMGFFMILLDTTIVNIAIPSIIDSFQASLDQILWVLNAYILVYAVLLITAGRLGDLFGRRQLFAVGVAVFTIASALAGQAQDINQLIAARILQGLGGALLTPQTLAILTSIFPPEKRGTAFGIWGAVGGVAAITGPTLGGLIVTNWSWRWIFYVNLPVGILAFVATFLIIPDLRHGRRHSLDIVGVVLSSTGLFAIVFGLIEGEHFDWGTVAGWLSIPEVIIAGIAILAAFTLWERTQSEPLLPFALFADRNFLLMNWVAAAMSFGMLGLFLPLTIYLQSALGLTALSAGLTVAPMSLVSMVVAPFAGRWSDKTGGKYILAAGLLIYAVSMGMITRLATPTTTPATLLIPMIVAGLGQGCIFAPMTTVAMRHISPRMAGAASGVLNTTRQLGGVLGSAVVGAVLQNQLVSSIHEQAISQAAKLPPQFQQQFVDGFTNAVKSGFGVGRGQDGGFQLSAGVPAQAAEQLRQISHDVFVNGFVGAMQPTMMVSVVVLVAAALSCLALEQQAQAAERAQANEKGYADWGT